MTSTNPCESLPSGCCRPCASHMCPMANSPNSLPSGSRSNISAAASALSANSTNGSSEHSGIGRPAAAAWPAMISRLSPYSSGVIHHAGIQPSPYSPVSRSIRGPWPATHTGGLPRPFGFERQAHAPDAAVGHQPGVEQRSQIAQHVGEDRHRLLERIAERDEALGLARPDAEDEPARVQIVQGQRGAGQVGGAPPRGIGDGDAEGLVGHRADHGAVAEGVVERVGVGGEVGQRDLAPQPGVEDPEDVVGRPVRVEPDLLVDLQHLHGAPERELGGQVDSDFHDVLCWLIRRSLTVLRCRRAARRSGRRRRPSVPAKVT